MNIPRNNPLVNSQMSGDINVSSVDSLLRYALSLYIINCLDETSKVHFLPCTDTEIMQLL